MRNVFTKRRVVAVILLGAAIIGIAAIGIGLFWYLFWDTRASSKARSSLEMELARINPIPGSALTSEASYLKPRSALIVKRYVASMSFERIRAYYDSELSSQGWRFDSEEELSWHGEPPGKVRTYCKGEYAATLEYFGAGDEAGWDFTLNLSWGVYTCRSR
jgi:hypothetical protein